MKKRKRVIVIDAATRAIEETDVETLEDMQRIVDGYIERAVTLKNGDEIYVNEEGLFNEDIDFFSVVEGGRFAGPFAGNAYVIGSVTRSGNSRSAKSSVAEIQRIVRFLGKATAS